MYRVSISSDTNTNGDRKLFLWVLAFREIMPNDSLRDVISFKINYNFHIENVTEKYVVQFELNYIQRSKQFWSFSKLYN